MILIYFLDATSSELNTVANVLAHMEDHIGLKMSKTKSKLMRIGTWQGSDTVVENTLNCDWTNGPINILGVHVCSSMEQCVELNFNPLLEK